MKTFLIIFFIIAIKANIYKESEGCLAYSVSDWNLRAWGKPDPEPIYCCSRVAQGYAFYYPSNSMAYGKDFTVFFQRSL